MQANTHFVALDSIEVANPCRADWNRMKGDGRTRFCATCVKNVYNLSGISRSEAEELVRASEGKLCVRFYLRADGTIITDDCPVGLRAMRRPLKWMATTLAIVAAPLFTFATVMTGGRVNAAQVIESLRQSPPVNTVFNWLQPPVPVGAMAIAGTPLPPPPPLIGKIAAFVGDLSLQALSKTHNMQCDEPDEGQIP